MFPVTAPQPWQRHYLAQLAAVSIGAGPVYALAIWGGLESYTAGSFQAPNIVDSLLSTALAVLVFGSLIVAALWFINGETVNSLQLTAGKLSSDLAHGISLGLTLLAAQLALGLAFGQDTLREFPQAVDEIGQALAADPLLLAVWLGPVVWLQAALLEELTRVFILSRLWRVWPSNAGKLATILGSSLLFGMGHAYQGAFGILGTSVIGLLLGLSYYERGRVLPLILAHGIYNSVVIILLVIGHRMGAFEPAVAASICSP